MKYKIDLKSLKKIFNSSSFKNLNLKRKTFNILTSFDEDSDNNFSINSEGFIKFKTLDNPDYMIPKKVLDSNFFLLNESHNLIIDYTIKYEDDKVFVYLNSPYVEIINDIIYFKEKHFKVLTIEDTKTTISIYIDLQLFNVQYFIIKDAFLAYIDHLKVEKEKKTIIVDIINTMILKEQEYGNVSKSIFLDSKFFSNILLNINSLEDLSYIYEYYGLFLVEHYSGKENFLEYKDSLEKSVLKTDKNKIKIFEELASIFYLTIPKKVEKCLIMNNLQKGAYEDYENKITIYHYIVNYIEKSKNSDLEEVLELIKNNVIKKESIFSILFTINDISTTKKVDSFELFTFFYNIVNNLQINITNLFEDEFIDLFLFSKSFEKEFDVEELIRVYYIKKFIEELDLFNYSNEKINNFKNLIYVDKASAILSLKYDKDEIKKLIKIDKEIEDFENIVISKENKEMFVNKKGKPNVYGSQGAFDLFIEVIDILINIDKNLVNEYIYNIEHTKALIGKILNKSIRKDSEPLYVLDFLDDILNFTFTGFTLYLSFGYFNKTQNYEMILSNFIFNESINSILDITTSYSIYFGKSYILKDFLKATTKINKKLIK